MLTRMMMLWYFSKTDALFFPYELSDILQKINSPKNDMSPFLIQISR